MKKKYIISALPLLLLLLAWPSATAVRPFLAESKYTFLANLAGQPTIIIWSAIVAVDIVWYALDAVLLFLFYKLYALFTGWIKSKKGGVV